MGTDGSEWCPQTRWPLRSSSETLCAIPLFLDWKKYSFTVGGIKPPPRSHHPQEHVSGSTPAITSKHRSTVAEAMEETKKVVYNIYVPMRPPAAGAADQKNAPLIPCKCLLHPLKAPNHIDTHGSGTACSCLTTLVNLADMELKHDGTPVLDSGLPLHHHSSYPPPHCDFKFHPKGKNPESPGAEGSSAKGKSREMGDGAVLDKTVKKEKEEENTEVTFVCICAVMASTKLEHLEKMANKRLGDEHGFTLALSDVGGHAVAHGQDAGAGASVKLTATMPIEKLEAQIDHLRHMEFLALVAQIVEEHDPDHSDHQPTQKFHHWPPKGVMGLAHEARSEWSTGC